MRRRFLTNINKKYPSVILYTNGSTTSPTVPYSTAAFDANIVSNVYDANTKYWSLTFDDQITTVGANAFYYKSIDKIIIPEGVVSIGAKAFYNNTYFQQSDSVTLPSTLTSIGTEAFATCWRLPSIVIPESVTRIDNYAFRGCTDLAEFTIPSNMETLGSNPFYYNRLTNFNGKWASADGRCIIKNNSLISFANKIDSEVGLQGYNVPEGVKSIAHSGFRQVTESVIGLPSSCTSIGGYAFGQAVLDSVDMPAVKTIGTHAFDHASIGYLTLPSTLTKIDSYAFNAASTLSSLVIPDSVTTIGDYAFADTPNLTDITLGKGVTSIGSNTFKNCTGTLKIKCSLSVGERNSTFNNLNYVYYSKFSTIIIDEPITSIPEYTFWECTSITNVIFPKTLKYIRTAAFSRCPLTNLVIPDSVEIIEVSAFKNNRALESVYIGSGVTNLNNPFIGCTSLREITGPNATSDKRGLILDGVFSLYAEASGTTYNIPNSVTEIGYGAFYECSSLTSITIPDNVTTIGKYVFFNCSGLTSVDIPDSVITIGDYAFCRCDSLTSVTIPDSVTTIGNGVFSSCSRLTSVTIGDGVTSIGNQAFYNCGSLATVYCKCTTPPAGGSSMFYVNASGRKIYVPIGSGNAYKTASGWSSYADYIEEYDFS